MNINLASEIKTVTAATPVDRPWEAVGEAFLQALVSQDFVTLEALFSPEARFRSLVPNGERFGQTAAEAVGWLKRWFGGADSLEVLQCSVAMMIDRLYLSYRLRVHDEDGWTVIEQQAFCTVKDGKIANMALVCSGFRPDPSRAGEFILNATPEPRSQMGGNVFYSAGSKGCAEGPLDDIAGLMRKMEPGQTLEVYATDPSVAGDLPAWCRLSGHQFVNQSGDHFLIRHK
jgi:Sulfurtransferase TusA/SnoaL-like domain